MKRIRSYAIAVAATAIVVSTALAANPKVVWSTGYPKQGGAGSGVIQVQGTFTLDAGYTYKSAAVAW
jgi:hypothetical protein